MVYCDNTLDNLLAYRENCLDVYSIISNKIEAETAGFQSREGQVIVVGCLIILHFRPRTIPQGRESSHRFVLGHRGAGVMGWKSEQGSQNIGPSS